MMWQCRRVIYLFRRWVRLKGPSLSTKAYCARTPLSLVGKSNSVPMKILLPFNNIEYVTDLLAHSFTLPISSSHRLCAYKDGQSKVRKPITLLKKVLNIFLTKC